MMANPTKVGMFFLIHLIKYAKQYTKSLWMSIYRFMKSFTRTQIKINYRNSFFYSPNVYHFQKFGKGTLSRAEPTWFQRHYEGYQPTGLSEIRLLSSFEKEKVGWYDYTDKEEYVLMPEEVFYLYQLGKACVYQNDQRVNVWTTCCSAIDSFPSRYKIYQHYRNAGWIVRSGLLFGCDFVLYPNTVEHHHSDFCVWIVYGAVDSLTFLARARSINHVKKQLIVCQVTHVPSDTSLDGCLDDITFRELGFSRWVPNIESEL